MRSIFVSVLCSLPLVAFAADMKPAKTDVSFSEKAAKGSMMEVDAGKIAVAKGQSDGVKKFGQHLIDDHSKLNDELSALATKKDIKLPASVDAMQKKNLDKLSNTPADKFDADFIKAMIDDHKKDIAEFEKAEKTAKDPELKEWITATLPKLRMHLDMAQKLKS